MHTPYKTRLALPSSTKGTNIGFTLVEMLLVIALIVMLAGIAVYNAGSILGTNKVQIAKAQVAGFEPIMMNYLTIEMNYPKSLNAIPPKFFKGSKLANDPWDNPYQYAYPGKHNTESYDIWSMGPDGQSGTADDIGNW